MGVGRYRQSVAGPISAREPRMIHNSDWRRIWLHSPVIMHFTGLDYTSNGMLCVPIKSYLDPTLLVLNPPTRRLRRLVFATCIRMSQDTICFLGNQMPRRGGVLQYSRIAKADDDGAHGRMRLLHMRVLRGKAIGGRYPFSADGL